MAQLNFGGTIENVVIRDEFPLEKAREVLKDETIAVIGYGVQGPGQSLNLDESENSAQTQSLRHADDSLLLLGCGGLRDSETAVHPPSSWKKYIL